MPPGMEGESSGSGSGSGSGLEKDLERDFVPTQSAGGEPGDSDFIAFRPDSIWTSNLQLPHSVQRHTAVGSSPSNSNGSNTENESNAAAVVLPLWHWDSPLEERTALPMPVHHVGHGPRSRSLSLSSPLLSPPLSLTQTCFVFSGQSTSCRLDSSRLCDTNG
jgi:hypothetical protein